MEGWLGEEKKVWVGRLGVGKCSINASFYVHRTAVLSDFIFGYQKNFYALKFLLIFHFRDTVKGFLNI